MKVWQKRELCHSVCMMPTLGADINQIDMRDHAGKAGLHKQMQAAFPDAR
jgi:hypothetical protein